MKKTILISGGVVILVLLLAGAAFVGGGLLNGEGQGFNLPFGFGSNDKQNCDVTRVVAPELPGPPMMRRAVLVRRQGNSIFIGVPQRNLSVSPNGTASQTNSFDGPIIEVVVTHDTKIYQDVTMQNYSGVCGRVQQILAPGKLDDIAEDATFLVWGQRNGNRVIASHLVYELPAGGK